MTLHHHQTVLPHLHLQQTAPVLQTAETVTNDTVMTMMIRLGMAGTAATDAEGTTMTGIKVEERGALLAPFPPVRHPSKLPIQQGKLCLFKSIQLCPTIRQTKRHTLCRWVNEHNHVRDCDDKVA